LVNNMKHHLECMACGAKYKPEEVLYVCRKCRGLLDVRYDYREVSGLRSDVWADRPLSVWRYRELLPEFKPSSIVSFGEGGTGLHRCSRLANSLGVRNLYLKNEGENPTGSFKDRGMTVGVSKAVELNAHMVACASTGNTSASLAAYAAKAGLQCVILIPSGEVAFGKLAQAVICGAKIVQIRGNFDEALKIVLQLSELNSKLYLLNSVNPYRLEGQKTLGYEVCEQLNYRVPDRIVLPVGNAGNISAIWKGFVELHRLELIRSLPRMVGVQAEGAAPIARAFKSGRSEIEPVVNPKTAATAIRIGSPINWRKALTAVVESEGLMEIVSDEEILQAQKLLASLEGLFVEPASASSIAGLRKLVEGGFVDRDEEIVCVATGHGLKDPDIVMKVCEKPVEADPNLESIRNVLKI